MHVSVVGVPADLGAARRGTDMGPSAIRYAKLREQLTEIGHVVTDLGNLAVPVAESRPVQGEHLKYLPEIEVVCRELADTVAEISGTGRLPLVLGGDHSLAIGSVTGLTRVRSQVGVVWLDAHGDFNTPETSPSGNIHGMPLAVLTGHGEPALVLLDGRAPKVRAQDVALVGVRDLDMPERSALRDSGVRVFTMKEIDRLGVGRVMEDVCNHFVRSGLPVHLSFDLDVLDPRYAPGVGTPVSGGLTYREAHLALELLADANVLCSLEFVEVNPILDQGNETARLAVELAASALGKRIL